MGTLYQKTKRWGLNLHFTIYYGTGWAFRRNILCSILNVRIYSTHVVASKSEIV